MSVVTKGEVYEFMKDSIAGKLSTDAIVSKFIELHPGFSECEGNSLHRRLSRVYNRITKYKKYLKSSKIKKQHDEFIAELFTSVPESLNSSLDSLNTSFDSSFTGSDGISGSEFGDFKDGDFSHMKEVNIKLLEYVRTLEEEVEELKGALSKSYGEVLESVEQYDKALEAMKVPSDEAEKKYDYILKSASNNRNSEGLENQLTYLEEKYKEQSKIIKQKEAEIRFYHDENVRKRDIRHKLAKTQLRLELKAEKGANSNLSKQIGSLLLEKEKLAK